MSFGDHLEDLRRRLIFALVGLVPIFITALVVGRPLLGILVAPAERAMRAAGIPAYLQATGPYETFGTYVQLALVLTALVGSPWALYQLWRFVSPGLYAQERKFVYILVPLSGLLTVLSGLFLYFVMLPLVLTFFITFAQGVSAPWHAAQTGPLPEGTKLTQVLVLDHDPEAPTAGDEWINTALMQRRVCLGVDEKGKAEVRGSPLLGSGGIAQQYKISDYVSMLMNMALALGLGFQLPVAMMLLGWTRLVSAKFLARSRRYVIAICTIGGAILTPSDPMSLIVLAVPMYVLFEIGLVLMRWAEKPRSLEASDEVD